MLLTSPLLDAIPGVRHAFSTRLGGVSGGTKATLNLAGTDDDPAHIAENRRRFAQALGFRGTEAIVQADQVHGIRVVEAADAKGAEADAIVASTPGTLVGVRTADCVPILLVATTPEGAAAHVAAVHAGWRGATAGIVAAAVETLRARGAPARQLRAAIGPCISVAHFEVGPEVVTAAEAALGAAPRTMMGSRGRPHLDLVDLSRRLLLKAGLHEEAIDVVTGCTYDNAAMFHSYRRDGQASGRMLSAIAFGGPA